MKERLVHISTCRLIYCCAVDYKVLVFSIISGEKFLWKMREVRIKLILFIKLQAYVHGKNVLNERFGDQSRCSNSDNSLVNFKQK